MALFTDSVVSTLDQLAAQDSAVLDVASSEGIDVTGKLRLAQDELGAELVAAGALVGCSPSSAVAWWPGVISASGLSVESIVVTPPLQMWHAFRALELTYRDAYYNQLNDRYLGKWNAYKDLSKWAARLLFQTGVGLVADPIPIAVVPRIRVVPGGLAASTYFVQLSWLNSRAEEGVASPIASVSVPDDASVQVTPTEAPTNVQRWNVYMGSSVDSIMRQNDVPLSLDQSWVLPDVGVVVGPAPGAGQGPNYFRQLPHYLQRG